MSRIPLAAWLPLGLLLSACSPPETGGEHMPRPAVVVRPQAADAVRDTLPGEIHARYEPALAFRIGGKISRRLVEVGDRVQEGQPLAELSAEDLHLELDAARARLASAEAAHRLATSELERYRALRERQLVSESDFDAMQNRYDNSAAQLEQARAQRQVAGNQAAYAVLKAPRQGVIARRLAEAGQVVAAGQTVFALAADGDREVRIHLPEQDIGRYAVGQPLAVELWSRPGQLLPARIRELAPAADAISRTFEARVAFDSEQPEVELGQSARVFVQRGARPGALSLPLSALTADDGQPFVWVLDPEKLTLHKTQVQVGPYGAERVPVLAGLEPDSWVVAAGTHVVREGQRVRPVDRSNRPLELPAL